MATDITTLKNWFKTGLKPTQAQFWSWIDSYWHKDEKLPISNIENLENVLNSKASDNHSHSEYATNDATSLTDENTLEWQKKLKISDLKFDDKSITVTQDYSDFGLQTGATINSFNNSIYQTVRNKLDAPLDEGTTTDYPYVVGVNDDNDSVKLPAGDLGKNFANTDLVVSSTRKHTGTASVEFGMPLVFSNASQKFSALPDKSGDATFNQFALFDSNGNLAKATVIGNAFESGLRDLPADQALRIGQLLNGGSGSSGIMSINSIVPPLISNQNEITYVVVKGANLYLNSLDYSLSLVNSITKEEILIPSDNIQLNTAGLSLVFYYNFSKLSLGDYKVKLTSGVKIYISSLVIKLTNLETVENIDLSNNTWELLENTTNTDFKNYTKILSPTSISLISLSNIKNLAGNHTVFKSSKLFNKDENFVMEINYEFPVNSGIPQITLGINYNDLENSLNNIPLNTISTSGWYYGPGGNSGTEIFLLNIKSLRVASSTTNRYSTKLTIIKEKNLLSFITNGMVTQQVIDNNRDYSLVLLAGQSDLANTNVFNFNITKAYKF